MIRNCQLFGTKICERILRYIIMCTRYMPKLHPEIFEIIEENEKNIKIKFDHEKMTIVKIVEMISKYGDIVDIHMKEAELEDILKEIYRGVKIC